ncbi:MAG: cytochrome c biogenesis protein CcdA [Paracoccaceae bacterium]
MENVTLISAFWFGLGSFLTPCVLPMAPFQLSYAAGLTIAELRETGSLSLSARMRLMLVAVLFALGVTTIFVLLGMGSSYLGQALREYMDILRWLAAAVLFIFGLHFLGIWRIGFLLREAKLEANTSRGSLPGAYAMGLAFGFGWTPCVGPLLGAVLFQASQAETLMGGGGLLAVYGLGMTLPFIAIAAFAQVLLPLFSRYRGVLLHVEKVMGAMLIIFAILIATNAVNYIAEWMIETMPSLLEGT